MHSTSVLPLSKITQVVPGDPTTFTIFASACPDAFPDNSPPLAEMSYDRRQTIREHRQLGISMKSGHVYVSLPHAVLSACQGLCWLSIDHTCLLATGDAHHSHAAQASLAACVGFSAGCADWMC